MVRYTHRPTIRFFEVDQQRVVYHMWYLAYFEDARNAMFTHHGMSLRELNNRGHDVQIVHYSLDWVGPVRWGDDLTVSVQVDSLGTSSFTLRYEAAGADGKAVTASAVYVAVRRDLPGTVPIPPDLLTALGTEAT